MLLPKMGFRFCVVLIGVTFGSLATGVAGDQVLDSDHQTRSDMVLLTVDKSNMSASLYLWPRARSSALRRIKGFRVAMGKEEGDKQEEGDNKTPEGIYLTGNQIPDRALPAKYGARAITLNFPNPFDRFQRKTGHGIWLHGVEDASRIEEAKVTEGCVAFFNEDIERLSQWLKPHHGFVVIANSEEDVNRDGDWDAVRGATEGWMKAWSKRDIAGYTGHYSHDFYFRGGGIKAFKKYKSKVFSSYKNMDVLFDDLRVITHPKYAVALFNQDFNGDDRFTSNGRKILYWTKEKDGSWKILREVYENKRFEAVEYTDEEVLELSGLNSGQSKATVKTDSRDESATNL
jgi:murein L,D-transpeptidase YafK